jgi:polyisoprenyl-phosphate glycosyltransferase
MNSQLINISIVVPVYGCDESLHELHSRLVNVLANLVDSYEIILVDDCGPGKAWSVIQNLSEHDESVIGIRLSRNFGQHYAITAGLDYAKGDWCIVMDCDLQDQPEEIIKLYNKAQEGYHVVVGKRVNRKDNFFVKITSKLFYVLFNYLSEQRLDNRVANYGIYSKKVIENVKKYKEKDRSFGLLVTLVGFSKAEIEIEHASRASGKSSYNFRKRMGLAMDYILSHSNKPLLLAVKTGFICSLVAVIYAVWLIIRFFIWSQVVDGWTSIMVSLFFLSGLIVSVTGMVGVYIGKIYNEVKERPLYIIDKTTLDK